METAGSRVDPDLGDALASRGWAVLPACLDPGLVAALQREVEDAGLGGMRRAGIGRGRQRQVADAVRGDWIRWLDGSTTAQRELLERLEAIRIEVNRALMLGLFEVEAHFALYPPGAGYERHLDAFQHDNPRRLSAVLYLNHDWRPSDGGELALYDAEGNLVERVPPEAGTLVLFLSQTVPHAVLPTKRRRASVAAWFRVRQPDALPGGAAIEQSSRAEA